MAAVCFAAVIAVAFWQFDRTYQKRAAVARDERFLLEVYQALLQPLFDNGAFPSSLDAPELQPFLRERHIVFEPERRLTYYPPSTAATNETVLMKMETPRGQFLLRYDGKIDSPLPREKRPCDEAFFSIINNDPDVREKVVSISIKRRGSVSKTFEAGGIQRVSAFLSRHTLHSSEIPTAGDLRTLGEMTIKTNGGIECRINICRMAQGAFVLRPDFSDIFLYFSDVDGLFGLASGAEGE